MNSAQKTAVGKISCDLEGELSAYGDLSGPVFTGSR